jgi:hypothetical protein
VIDIALDIRGHSHQPGMSPRTMAKPELITRMSSMKAPRLWATTMDGATQASRRKNADMTRMPRVAKELVYSAVGPSAQTRHGDDTQMRTGASRWQAMVPSRHSM